MQEGICQEDEHQVMLPALPRAAFKMIEPQFVLQFPVTVFDPPTVFRGPHQMFEGGRRRLITEEILRANTERKTASA